MDALEHYLVTNEVLSGIFL